MQAHREIGTDKGKQLMASSSTLTYVYRASYQQHPSVCMCIPQSCMCTRHIHVDTNQDWKLCSE